MPERALHKSQSNVKFLPLHEMSILNIDVVTYKRLIESRKGVGTNPTFSVIKYRV